jgi:predicted DNA-binding ribbon-helix-helix protein
MPRICNYYYFNFTEQLKTGIINNSLNSILIHQKVFKRGRLIQLSEILAQYAADLVAREMASKRKVVEEEPEVYQKPRVMRKNVTINGKRTTVKLETDLWEAIVEICDRADQTIDDICAIVWGANRESENFTSDLRLFVHHYHRDRLRRLEEKLAALETQNITDVA